MDFDVLLTIVLSSFGGTAIALIGLTKFLGGIVSKRIEQKEKLVLDKQLENYKYQLEITRDSLSRYSESQFSLYNVLWKSLYS